MKSLWIFNFLSNQKNPSSDGEREIKQPHKGLQKLFA